MKKFILPLAVVAIGAGSAFATNTADAKDAAIVPAYRMDPESGLCVLANQNCSTVSGAVCRWSADGITPLHDEPAGPTECGRELFKP